LHIELDRSVKLYPLDVRTVTIPVYGT